MLYDLNMQNIFKSFASVNVHVNGSKLMTGSNTENDLKTMTMPIFLSAQMNGKCSVSDKMIKI